MAVFSIFDGTNWQSIRGGQGIQGPQGNTGVAGPTGISNYTGATGVQGPTGFYGQTGIQGLTGFYGQTGIQGLTGFYGQTGIQGITGIYGQTGVQGPTGVQGQTGIQGLTGIYGHTGVQGPAAQPGTAAYGEMTISNDSTATTLSLQNTWYQITNGWNAGDNNGMSFITDHLRADTSGTFTTVCSLSLICSSSAQNLLCGIFKDGTVVQDHELLTRMGTATEYNSVTITGIVANVAVNDTFDLRIQNQTSAGTTVTVVWANFNMLAIAGAQGQTGIQGLTGFYGQTGIQGLTGMALGSTGVQGPTGFYGQTGIQGVTGFYGQTGIQGVTGFYGQTGIQGYTGFYGQTGIQGVTGFYGQTGIQGQTGIRGATGLQGPQGLQGIQGDVGSQGVTGFYGRTGIQGVTGLYGQTGIQGLTGLANFIDTTTYPTLGITPILLWNYTDEALFVGATGVGHWVQISSGGLQGSSGIQGLTGMALGATGVQGPQGPTGIQGVTGLLTSSRSFVVSYPTESSNSPLWRSPVASTVTAVHLLSVDGTNVVGKLWDYDANGSNGAAMHVDTTSISGTNVDVLSFTKAGIDASSYVGWKTTSVSGNVSRTIITFEYTTP